MVWYKPFFGDHASVNGFFGIPAHAEAEETHATDVDHALAAEGNAAPDAVGAAAVEAGPGVASETAPSGGESDHAATPHGWEAGAIFMAQDNHVMDDAHHSPALVKMSPFFAMLIGFGLAWLFYVRDPSIPGRLAASQPGLYRFLLNKWYFDELYDRVFVRPALWLGRLLWKRGDGAAIDGGINGLALGLIPYITRLAGRAQSGYVFHYAFAMVLGIVAITLWLSIRSAG
jgi:NADH-quinone oxidoreductase subunit L